MKNPLDTTEGAGRKVALEDMKPGETRAWMGTGVFVRTERPVHFDIRDANAATMSDSARARGLEWFVTPTGDVKLGTTQRAMLEHLQADYARRERDRQAHNRRVREEAERQAREAA